jgi:phosphopentomutase
VGAGELPDAEGYGDRGSNTLGNLSRSVGGLDLPHLAALGLGNILQIQGVPPAERPKGAFGRMAEVNPGKDSTSGHWEIAGVRLSRPFPTFPDGFPRHIIRAFEDGIGRATLGNEVASGTEIIQRLGNEHVRTGYPIVYTSADSVFQIAAHEEIVPLDRLYEMCRIARRLLVGENGVGRVIARPFLGRDGRYSRTGNRRDFSIEPTGPTVLDRAKEHDLPVTAIGKIVDLYAGRGMTEQRVTHGNAEGMAEIERAMERCERGLIMANLVDFDTLWGHRNDPEGFKRGLEEFDAWLPRALSRLKDEDLLVMTADHGNDPTTPSTDHSREYVPIVATGPRIRPGREIGVRSSFADLGATIAEHLGLDPLENGSSFHAEIFAGGGAP